MSQKATGLKVSFLSIFFSPPRMAEDEELAENVSFRPTPAQDRFIDVLHAEGLEKSDAVRRVFNLGMEVGEDLRPYMLMVIHAAQLDERSISQTISALVADGLEARFPGMSKQLGIKKK